MNIDNKNPDLENKDKALDEISNDENFFKILINSKNDPIKFVEKVMGILFYVNFIGVAVLTYLYVDAVKYSRYSWYEEDILLFGFIFILGCFLHLISWSISMIFVGMAKDLRSLNKKN